MATPMNNIAAGSIQRSIKHWYTLQEECLNVNYITGSLFERDVIDFHLMQKIQSEPVQFKKNRLLINHLLVQNCAVIHVYCDILKQSADSSKFVLPAHARIALKVKKQLEDDEDSFEEWEKKILCFLSVIDPTRTASSRAVFPSSARNPPRVQPTGILTRKIHQTVTNTVINLDRQTAEKVVDQIMSEGYPVDLQVAVLQVGCNDSERYIPKLESKGLALCRREDCQNPLTLKFRLHTHLAWCYFISNPVKFRDHFYAAVSLQYLVDYDVVLADLMLIHGASLAYDALQSDSLTPELEQLIVKTVIPAALEHGKRNAVNFDSVIFLETAMFDVLFIYIVLAECHKRRGNRDGMTSHMKSMKELAQNCNYELIHSLLRDSKASWFGKLLRLLKLPATKEELLECNDPSQLLQFPCIDRSSEVKEATRLQSSPNCVSVLNS